MSDSAVSVAFYVNPTKPETLEKVHELEGLAHDYGMWVMPPKSAEVLIALGGDGTMLRAVHDYPNIPVLGLNLGGLGYLSSVGPDDFERCFHLLSEGCFTVSKRSMLMVYRKGDLAPAKVAALNDIVAVREMSGHCARLDLTVDGLPATQYMADGVIFSTPTGSTAYSLSAGGPVLMPDSDCFVVTPMNPHALGVRPIVVRDGSVFCLELRARESTDDVKVGVYADGNRIYTLVPGESLVVSKSPRVARLVELLGYDPYDVLARKLGWSGSNVK